MSALPSERFSNRVENYVKYRPDYPKEIVDSLREKIDLKRATVIADIGSGTGISSKLFLEVGNVVFGIEPNRSMRHAAEDYLSSHQTFHSIDGTAENTGLGDSSIDIVMSFQAFHWFDNAITRKEFRRILRMDGYLVLVWNERQLDSNDFLRDYERLLVEFGTDYQKIRHDRISKESIEKSFGKPFEQESFANVQSLDFEGLKGRTLSASYVPAENDQSCADMLTKLNGIFSTYEEKGRIRVPYETKLFYGMI